MITTVWHSAYLQCDRYMDNDIAVIPLLINTIISRYLAYSCHSWEHCGRSESNLDCDLTEEEVHVFTNVEWSNELRFWKEWVCYVFFTQNDRRTIERHSHHLLTTIGETPIRLDQHIFGIGFAPNWSLRTEFGTTTVTESISKYRWHWPFNHVLSV